MTVLMHEMTWPRFEEIIRAGAPVFLAVGATEQHGFHLPLGVDYLIAQGICLKAAEIVHGAVAPAIQYGFRSQVRTGGGSHRIGTIGISASCLSNLVAEVIVELARDGVRRVVIVDGHYENRFILDDACARAIDSTTALGLSGLKIVKVVAGEPISPSVLAQVYANRENLGAELEHAAYLETSLMLAVRPDLVGDDWAIDEHRPSMPPFDLFPENSQFVPASGCLATPDGSNKEIGQLLFDDTLDLCLRSVRAAFPDLPQ